MSMSVSARTNGKPIRSEFNNIHPHPRLDQDVSYIHLYIGDDEISISFSSAEEMIAFCEQHNIPYKDQRTKVDKYLSRKRMEAVA